MILPTNSNYPFPSFQLILNRYMGQYICSFSIFSVFFQFSFIGSYWTSIGPLNENHIEGKTTTRLRSFLLFLVMVRMKEKALNARCLRTHKEVDRCSWTSMTSLRSSGSICTNPELQGGFTRIRIASPIWPAVQGWEIAQSGSHCPIANLRTATQFAMEQMEV